MATLVALDIGTLWTGRVILRALRDGAFGSQLAAVVQSFLSESAVSGSQLAGALVLGLLVSGSYRAGDSWQQPVRVLGGTGVAVTLALYADLWHGNPALVVPRGVAIWLAVSFSLILARGMLSWILGRVPRPGLGHRVLEIHGHGHTGPTPDLGPDFRLLATLDAGDLPTDIEDMADWLEGGVDTILVSGDLHTDDFERVTDFALAHGCRLFTVPRSERLVGVEPTRVWIRGVPLFQITAPTLRASQLLLKRVLDLTGAAILVVLFAPVMLLIAVVVKMDSAGPILFRHRRAGEGGRFFDLLKFRSMRSDAEELLRNDPELYREYVANDFKLPEARDPRVTRLGRFLRKSSLDELPQLFNVLKGDMSLVGPRPVIEPELEMYRGRIPTFLSVKPGLTGLWQVSGRSNIGFPERAELDLKYVRNWSLLGDIWILLMTVPAVLLRRGAH